MPPAGDALPRIALPATDGAMVDVSALDGTNVLLFLPEASVSLALFWRDGYVARRCAGLDRVIAISPQPVESLAAARARLDLPFHFLSDPEDRLGRAFNLLHRPALAIVRARRLEAVLPSCTKALAYLALESPMSLDDLRTSAERPAAPDDHEHPRPGKLEIRATKPLATGLDLSRAHSPGVAEACLAIETDSKDARRYTAKGNLVAVISNGTAVPGLGDIGAQASEPVMEGKAALSKKFADLDCFDIEVNETDPVKLTEIVCALEPTFGAGAAGIACLRMMIAMGVRHDNITMRDSSGVVHAKRNDLSPQKVEFARDISIRTMIEALAGADLFLGVSGPGLLTAEMVRGMAPHPIILALANPTPEMMPEEARAASPDALIATRRSDCPNQVNNFLCLPFIFRGALDVGATEIDDAMKVACVEAIGGLARAPASPELGTAYAGERPMFGPGYLIPKPFDPRLLPTVACAVAKAAMESGVATREIDLDTSRAKLQGQVYSSAPIMRPVFEAAHHESRRIVFAEGEDPRGPSAVHAMSGEPIETAILVGRLDVVAARIEREGLEIRPGEHFALVNPESDERYRDYGRPISRSWPAMASRPTSRALSCEQRHRHRCDHGAARRGEANATICGTVVQYRWHLDHLRPMPAEDGLHPVGALSLVIPDRGPLFVTDTNVHTEPDARQLADTAIAAARHVRRFGIEPKVARCSGSQFGNLDSRSGRVARAALALLDAEAPAFEYEGEMHTDAALDPELRERLFPGNRLSGRAKVLVCTNTDAAGAARNLLKSAADGLEDGPVLMETGNRAHIVTPGVTIRGLLNIAALAGMPVVSYG